MRTRRTEMGYPFTYNGKVGIEFFDKNENLIVEVRGMSKRSILELAEALIRVVNRGTRQIRLDEIGR